MINAKEIYKIQKEIKELQDRPVGGGECKDPFIKDWGSVASKGGSAWEKLENFSGYQRDMVDSIFATGDKIHMIHNERSELLTYIASNDTWTDYVGITGLPPTRWYFSAEYHESSNNIIVASSEGKLYKVQYDTLVATELASLSVQAECKGVGLAIDGDDIYTLSKTMLEKVNINTGVVTQLAPAPNSTSRNNISVVGDKVISFNRGDNSFGEIEGKLYIYSIANNSWRDAESSVPVEHVSVGFASKQLVYNGKIYRAGGYSNDYLSTILIFDPITETFKTGVDMTFESSQVGLAIIDNALFAFGGEYANATQIKLKLSPSDTSVNVQFKRGTTELIAEEAGLAGQLIVNTDDNSLHLMDGVTLGGHKVGDTTEEQSAQIEKNKTDITELSKHISDIQPFVKDWGNLPTTPMENSPITDIVFPDWFTLDIYPEYSRVIRSHNNGRDSTASLCFNVEDNRPKYDSFGLDGCNKSSNGVPNVLDFTGLIKTSSSIGIESIGGVTLIETNSIKMKSVWIGLGVPESLIAFSKTSGTQSIKANVSLLKGESFSLKEYKGIEGEITVNTDDNSLNVMDGVTLGGHKVAMQGSTYNKTEVDSLIDAIPVPEVDTTLLATKEELTAGLEAKVEKVENKELIATTDIVQITTNKDNITSNDNEIADLNKRLDEVEPFVRDWGEVYSETGMYPARPLDSYENWCIIEGKDGKITSDDVYLYTNTNIEYCNFNLILNNDIGALMDKNSCLLNGNRVKEKVYKLKSKINAWEEISRVKYDSERICKGYDIDLASLSTGDLKGWEVTSEGYQFIEAGSTDIGDHNIGKLKLVVRGCYYQWSGKPDNYYTDIRTCGLDSDGSGTEVKMNVSSPGRYKSERAGHFSCDYFINPVLNLARGDLGLRFNSVAKDCTTTIKSINVEHRGYFPIAVGDIASRFYVSRHGNSTVDIFLDSDTYNSDLDNKCTKNTVLHPSDTSVIVQHKRGNSELISSYRGSNGEVVVNTETNSLHIMDGQTLGGTIVSGTDIVDKEQILTNTSDIAKLESAISTVQGFEKNWGTIQSGITKNPTQLVNIASSVIMQDSMGSCSYNGYIYFKPYSEGSFYKYSTKNHSVSIANEIPGNSGFTQATIHDGVIYRMPTNIERYDRGKPTSITKYNLETGEEIATSTSIASMPGAQSNGFPISIVGNNLYVMNGYLYNHPVIKVDIETLEATNTGCIGTYWTGTVVYANRYIIGGHVNTPHIQVYDTVDNVISTHVIPDAERSARVFINGTSIYVSASYANETGEDYELKLRMFDFSGRTFGPTISDLGKYYSFDHGIFSDGVDTFINISGPNGGRLDAWTTGKDPISVIQANADTSNLNGYMGFKAQLVVNTDDNSLHVMDGKTLGGTKVGGQGEQQLIFKVGTPTEEENNMFWIEEIIK